MAKVKIKASGEFVEIFCPLTMREEIVTTKCKSNWGYELFKNNWKNLETSTEIY